MSLKFNDAIEIVAEKLLKAPKPDYETYLKDAAEISQKINQELIKINSIFKGTVTNWDDTALFLNAEVPKIRIPLLRLKLPFMVEPQRVSVFSRDKVQPVNLKTSVNHPAVENGYLNGEKLTKLFILDLNRVIDRISNVTCRSGKIYKLCIEFKEHPIIGLVIDILAKENDLQNYPSIAYEFILYFLFKNESFGYSYVSNFFHQSEHPAAAAELQKNGEVWRSVQILIQKLGNLPNLLIFRMQSVFYFMEIETFIVGSALLDAIQNCIPHLQNPGPLISAYGKLLQFKQSDSVNLTELMEVFGLK